VLLINANTELIISSLEKMLDCMYPDHHWAPVSDRPFLLTKMDFYLTVHEVSFVILEKRDRFPFTIERRTLCM